LGSTGIILQSGSHVFIGANIYDITNDDSDNKNETILVACEIAFSIIIAIIISWYAKTLIDRKIMQL
jgi:hypothetical protein